MSEEAQGALVRAAEGGGDEAPAGPGSNGPPHDASAPAGLDAGDRALLEYATKLTLTPGRMTRGDVDALREAGFDDRAIHDACAIVAYYAFVNRIADGLGVELEREPGGPGG
jgi:alkylhydroperoxidase family enzyme